MVATPSQLGPYRLERLLGSGGFANVYLAFDTRRGHHVALKVLHPHYALGVTLERFQREGEQILLLRHQHIVGAYAVEQVDGRYVIAMQYMPGGSLADLLRQRGRLNLPEAARIMNEVAAALDYVHPKVVHRDLKPSNVLFDAQGRACVADFGIARISDRPSLTATGQAMGTPHYMAPEQVRPRMAPISPATDVWALGVMLYEMLCGQAPFIGEDSTAVLYQVVHETPPRPTELISRLTPAVDRILTRALAKDPRKRYQRAGDLARDVRSLVRPTPKPRVVKRRWTEQPTLHAPADHLGQPTVRAATPVPRHRRGGPALWIGLGIVGVVVVALLVSSLVRTWRRPAQPTPVAVASRSRSENDVESVATRASATETPSREPSLTVSAPVVTSVPTTAEAGGSSRTDTPTPTRTPTASRTPTAMPADTLARSPTPTPTAMRTPTPAPSVPTATPTATVASPTPTLAAPEAVKSRAPANGSSFSGPDASIVFLWDDTVALDDDEYYVLHISFPHGTDTWRDVQWTKEPSLAVPDYIYANATLPGVLEWYVVVMRQTGTSADGLRVGVELGPRSETWTFEWRPDGGEPGDGITPTPTPRRDD